MTSSQHAEPVRSAASPDPTDTEGTTDTPSRAVASSTPALRRPWWRTRIAEWIGVAALITLLSFLVVGEHIAKQPLLSPVDEPVYIDYVLKVPEQGIVRQGEDLGDETRGALSCRGVFWFGQFAPQTCATGDHSEDDLYPYRGLTSADAYTPIYPALTWVGMQLFEFAGVDDWISAMRWTGVLWLIPGLLVLYAALRRLNFRPLTAIAPPLVLLGSLPVLWSHTFVSTDATAILAGSLMLWCTARLLTTGRGVWLFTLCAVLVTLTKFQNIAAVGAAVLVLAWYAWRGAREPDAGPFRARAFLTQPLVLSILSSVVAVVVAQAVWVVVRASLAVGPSPDQGVGEPLTASRLVLESVGFFTEIGDGVSSAEVPRLGEWAMVLSAVLGVLVVVGTLGAALAPGLDERSRTFGTATTLMMVTLGPALIAVTMLISGDFFRLPGRYALSLLPFAFVGVVALLRNRWLSGGLCLLGFGMIAVSVARVVIQ